MRYLIAFIALLFAFNVGAKQIGDYGKFEKDKQKTKKIKKAELDNVKAQLIAAGYDPAVIETVFGSDEKKYYDIDLADKVREVVNASVD